MVMMMSDNKLSQKAWIVESEYLLDRVFTDEAIAREYQEKRQSGVISPLCDLKSAQTRIQELEAQVERLREALQELLLAWDEHQNPDDGVSSDAREALSETPAQSL